MHADSLKAPGTVRRVVLGVALALASATAFVACGGGGGGGGGFIAVTGNNIAATFGNNQTGTAGTALPQPLVVTVTASNGSPIQNVSINFSVVTGGGSVSPASGTTNAFGQAQTTLTLGTNAGTNTVLAAVAATTTGSISPTTSLSVTFTATGVAAASNQLTLTSGNNQSGLVNTAAGAPLVVTVRDANGNAVSGAAIVFAVTGGSGSLSTTQTVTGTNGQASTNLSFGPLASTITVTATIVGTSNTVTFTATSSLGTAAPVVAFNVPGGFPNPNTGGNLGFSDPRGLAVSQTTQQLFFTATANLSSAAVIMSATKTGGVVPPGSPIGTAPSAITSRSAAFASGRPAGQGGLLVEPVALALSANETTLFVLDIGCVNTNSDTVGAIISMSATDGTVFSFVVPAGAIDAPTAMVRSPDGSTLYVTGFDPADRAPAVFSIVLATGQLKVVTKGQPLASPIAIGISSNNQTLYVVDSRADVTNAATVFLIAANAAGGAPGVLSGISDQALLGAGVVIGFDGNVNVAAKQGAIGKLTAISPSGGSETVRAAGPPFNHPRQAARDGSNIYVVDGQTGGAGAIIRSN